MWRCLVLAWLAATGAGGGFAALVAHAAAQGNSVAEAEGDPRGNPLWGIPLSSLAGTRDRPIFLPSRRPRMIVPPAPVAAAPASAQPIAAESEQISLRLLGTITGPRNGIAICFNEATSDVIRLKTGDTFEGWVLREVQRREATFEKASLRTVLVMPTPGELQAMPSPPLPPAAASPQPGGPMPATASPQPAGPMPATASPPSPTPAAKGSGTWLDGDGQLIAPPPKSR